MFYLFYLFIHSISIAPPQVTLYSEALPTTARTLCWSLHADYIRCYLLFYNTSCGFLLSFLFSFYGLYLIVKVYFTKIVLYNLFAQSRPPMIHNGRRGDLGGDEGDGPPQSLRWGDGVSYI